mmetsp:Transcript_4408/g.10789  ORF Transcript_4408/g.10789 Transcript_4408/m.10789 type:complete len:213 (-) Transcript_4408:315-953(-)
MGASLLKNPEGLPRTTTSIFADDRTIHSFSPPCLCRRRTVPSARRRRARCTRTVPASRPHRCRRRTRRTRTASSRGSPCASWPRPGARQPRPCIPQFFPRSPRCCPAFSPAHQLTRKGTKTDRAAPPPTPPASSCPNICRAGRGAPPAMCDGLPFATAARSPRGRRAGPRPQVPGSPPRGRQGTLSAVAALPCPSPRSCSPLGPSSSRSDWL